MGSLVVFTGPAEEPLSVDELKSHLRIDTDDEDSLIGSYIMAVRAHIEEIAGIAFLTQTLEWSLDVFPGSTNGNPFGAIELPRPPLVSVTSITYTDVNGANQTVATSVYNVDTRTLPGRVTLKHNQEWPDTHDVPHAVVVKYVAGHTDPEAIPEDLRNSVRVLAGALYEHREELLVGETSSMTGLFSRLLAPHRMWVTV